MSNHSQPPGNGARQKKEECHEELVKWYKILLLSSRAIALSLDPLFFFVPVIHEDKKCISEDKKMWINALFWRSVLDFIYLVHFVVKFSNTFRQKGDGKVVSNNASIVQGTLGCGHLFRCIQCTNAILVPKDKASTEGKWAKLQRNFWIWIRFMFDILVILPIPQVLTSNILSEMRHPKYTNNVTILNAVILIQYGPRVLQIYLSLKKLENYKNIPIPIRASFNFFLYLLAGHVCGAFWYFFSTQRLAYCWRKACIHHGECVQGSFTCDHNFGNLSILHDFCSSDSTNTSTFNFGIFLEARRSGILESTDFPKKLIYSGWWGLRNLSSFGSNLQTSTYIWENAFALGISIFGLLLFLYLLGNLQVYMQRSASKSIEKSESDKYPALDEAVVESILNELGMLYKTRYSSKSNKKSPKKRWCGCC